MTNQDAIKKAKEVIEKCPFPAFATVDGEGCPQVRAMMPVLIDDDLKVFYITHRMSDKCRQIAANPNASNFWSYVVEPMANWSSVLVKGKAEITDDKALRDKFWMEPLRGFFPGGADDPNFVIVIVNPTEMILADNATMPAEVVKF